MRAIGLGLAGVVLGSVLQAPAQARDDAAASLDLLARAVEAIHGHYLRPVTHEALARAAIDGMLASLDPHSAYLPEPEYEAREAVLSGRVTGIGLDLQDRAGVVTVVAPTSGGPAAAAGLQPGDRVLRVDGHPVADLLLDEILARISGKPGTSVGLAVRSSDGRTRDLRLTRAVIHVPVVRSALFGGKAYIALARFDADAAADIAAAWADLARRAGGRPAGLVLDLRGNGGGELDQAVAVARLFLRRGAIVSIQGRRPADDLTYAAAGHDITGGAPIVVLVDAATASASEIVAGALQDHARAAILGTRSFGKGSVQETIPLGGDGALVLTTALFVTPSGRSIQALGITPDVIVHQAGDDPDAPSATEATLPHAIEPVDATDVPRRSRWRGIAARPPVSWPALDAARPATDFQLQQGLELLEKIGAPPQTRPGAGPLDSQLMGVQGPSSWRGSRGQRPLAFTRPP